MKRALPPINESPPVEKLLPPVWTGYPLVGPMEDTVQGCPVEDDALHNACYPFISDNGKPIGNTPKEAMHVAWAMSEVVKDSPETGELINLMRLKRSADNTDRVYSELAKNGDEDVFLGDIEPVLGFKIAVPSVPHPVCGDDPFCAKRIEYSIGVSMCSFVNSIDHVCTLMNGVARGQTTALAEENVVAAKKALVSEMTRLLTSASATKLDVQIAIDEVTKKYVPQCVRLHKERIKGSIRGVIALSRVCAVANTEGDALEREIQSHYSALQEVCSQPPFELEQQMAERGLSMAVLSSCFVDASGSGGCTILRPSLGGIAHTLQEFFTTIGEDFGYACASTLNLLKRYMSTPEASETWHAVDLEEAGSARATAAAAVSSLNDIQNMPCPAHTSAGRGFVIIKNSHSFGNGLRTARMLHVVSMAASKANVLIPRTFKSSLVLASIARFRSDASFHIGALDVKPTGAKRCARTPVQEDINVYIPREFVPKTIDPSMQRDFEILVAFRKSAPHAASVLSLRQINESVRALGGSFSNQRDSSLVQVVSHVSRKVIHKIQAEISEEYTLEYVPSVPGVSGGGYVRMDTEGSRVLRNWLHDMISSVERGDAAAVKRWHASRSSRSRAKIAGLSQKSRCAKGDMRK